MDNILKNKINWFLQDKLCTRDGYHYFKPLFDPIQTHALYGISMDEVDGFKRQLKALGASRFRIVKCRNSNFVILCFSAKGVKYSLEGTLVQ